MCIRDSDNGNVIRTLIGASNIVQNGSAPAVLVDGNGTPIVVGLVAEITDPENENFDESLQYAFINQGSVAANGVFDDFDATAIEIANTTLQGGFNNSGNLTSTTFVSPTDALANTIEGTGHARVIVFGDAAIADEINNSGIIIATSSEASDAVFLDSDNVLAPRSVLATAIEISSEAVVNSFQNSGGISALLVGREGCLLYTSPSPRDRTRSRMPSSA